MLAGVPKVRDRQAFLVTACVAMGPKGPLPGPGGSGESQWGERRDMVTHREHADGASRRDARYASRLSRLSPLSSSQSIERRPAQLGRAS